MPEHAAHRLEPPPGAGRESGAVAAMFDRAVHLTRARDPGGGRRRAARRVGHPSGPHGAAEDEPRAAWLALADDGHTAGLWTMVASGWRIDDEATAVLMTAPHAARVAGHGTAGALRAATRAVYESGRTHPALWAPFTLIGAED